MVGNSVLLLLFVWNGWQMYQAYAAARLALTSPILSDNPDQFAQQIIANRPSLWAWLIMLVSIGITVYLLLSWWIPRFKKGRSLPLANSLWLGGWGLYILLWIVVVVIVVTNLLRFT